MRVLLFGCTGLLGSSLERQLHHEVELIAVHSQAVDFRNGDSLREFIPKQEPDFIVNAAGYTMVDKAEEEQEAARAVNAIAPEIMAEYSYRKQIPLLHYSTDYVFDGKAGQPYREQDEPDPVNCYGRTKLEGERRISAVTDLSVILRTSWLYSRTHPCFVSRVLEMFSKQARLRMATDQVGSPTWAEDLAQASADIILKTKQDPTRWVREHAGLYHLAGEGSVSRYEWAAAILDHVLVNGAEDSRLEPARAADFPSPAVRPSYSALSSSLFSETFGAGLPPWKQSLDRALST